MGLKIQLFGRFCVWRQGEAEPIPRSDPLKAAASLRNRISQLRRVLEPDLTRGARSRYILTCRHRGYRFNPEGCELDIECFERAYHRGQALERDGRWGEALEHYERAAALYRGDYLSEDRYESWALAHQERWRRKYLSLITQMAACYAQIGRYRRAVCWAERAVELAPARSETVYRELMVYYAQLGDRAGVMHTYLRLRRTLAECFSVEPSQATESLAHELLAKMEARLQPQ